MWICWACQMMELVYWVAVPATRPLHKSPACSWWESLNGAAVLPLQRLEVKHTADGSRMAGAAVDSQIKHVHNEDKYWPRHRLKKRWDEKREGQGNAGVLIFFFFSPNKNLVRNSDQAELWSGTQQEAGWRDTEAHFKADKAAICRTVRSICDPSVGANLTACLWRGRNGFLSCCCSKTRQRQRRNVFPTAGGRWETTERWS